MLRLTGACMPANAAVADSSGLPIAALMTPLAPSPIPPTPSNTGDEIEIADQQQYISKSAPEASFVPRCFRCAAYISVHASLLPRTWECSLCTARNSLPTRYMAVVRAGTKALHYVPELSREVYDVPVADDVPITPIGYFFVVDINGDDAYLDAARVAVRQGLDVIDGETLAAVMLFGDDVTLIDARQKGGLLRSVSAEDEDVNPIDLLAPDQWLRPTCSSLTDTVMSILGELSPPTDVGSDGSKLTKHAFGSAVRTVLDMVGGAGLTGARVVCISAGEPNIGEGTLDATNNYSKDGDRFPSPSVNFYATQGARASSLGAMVDVYVLSKTPLDVASIAPLAQASGGRLMVYEPSEASLAQDVWKHLNDPTVLRGLLRFRTSSEIFTSDVYGCGLYRDAEVEEVFRLNCHGHSSTLAAEFTFTDKRGFTRKSRSNAGCVQVAFRGVFVEPGMLPQRVLRIETKLVPLATSPDVLRETADANAVATVMFHKAVAAADDDGISAARLLLFDWLAQLVAKSGSSSEIVTNMDIDPNLEQHNSLKKLPQLIFGLIRSFMFRQESVAADLRVAVRCVWEDLSPELLATAAYPRLISFRDIDEQGVSDLKLSSEAVKDCGDPIFLLDTFSEIIIYYGFMERRDLPFPPPESSSLMRTKAACIRDRPLTPRVVVCREGTPKDRWFKSYMIEDAAPTAGGIQSFSTFRQGIADAALEMIPAVR